MQPLTKKCAMTKSSTTSPIKNLDLAYDWSSHPAFEWLMNNKKIFIWGFLGLFVLLIAASRFATIRTLNAENDFFQAQAAFAEVQKEILPYENQAASTNLEELEAIMLRHPEIQPKYEGSLAQTLFITGNVPKAEKFANDIFKRTQPDYLQLYQDYSRTSLLIANGNYEEALTQAQQLKASLDQPDANGNPILYIYNLIRLAILYKETEQPKEELKTWEEFQNQPIRLEAVAAANKVLKIGQASLNQYIEQRKKTLSK